MSCKGNDMYNDYLADQYTEAMAIISKAVKTDRLLTQFKLWEHLEPEVRTEAIKDSFKKCDMCYQKFHVSKLHIAEENMYGTYFECKNCASRKATI